mgnify:CR=1 FL=1
MGEQEHEAGQSAERIRLRRVYDPPTPNDGLRILVDRLWPRGLTKEAARVDLWLRDVAPSNELRRWYGKDLTKWEEFRSRYLQELAERPEAIEPLLDAARRGPITLLYGKRDERHNQAVVLKAVLEERLRQDPA